MTQWHPLAHQRWANERLHFWRLGFFPTYRADDIVEGIRSAMEERRVTSATAYELIGIHDVLLRIWLPGTTDADEFQETLIARLGPADLRISEYFQVHRLVRNWVWAPPGESVSEPAGLRERPDDGLIAAAERGEEPALSDLRDRGLITQPDYHDDGIKFFLVVAASPATQSLAMSRRLETRLTTILDDAPPEVRERSLYAGQGFGQFIMMGNVEYAAFYKITSDLSARVNDAELQEAFLARSYTHLEGRPRPRIRVDAMPKFEEVQATPAKELLLQDESETFEVKGSAFLDIQRYINTDTLDWKNDKVTQAIVRSVVAFLNARGGTLVVGAVERRHFGDPARLEKLQQFGPVEIVGDYVCVGVAADFRPPEERWDGYQRGLQDILNSRIRPSPRTYLRVEKDRLDTLDICVITVRSPPHEERYPYYAVEDGHEVFYVREGSESRKLDASDVTSYMRRQAH